LDAPDFKAVVGAVSGPGKVPVLVDGEVSVWESLAIIEYVAEKFPAAGLWPTEPAARALARAVANEMHAGFQPLRKLMPMNQARPVIKRALTPEAAANVRRIEAMMALPAWREWHAAALKETWVLPEDEVDWPTVRRA